MSTIVWRDRVPVGSTLRLFVEHSPSHDNHDYVALAHVFDESNDHEIVSFGHEQLTTPGQATVELISHDIYLVDIAVAFAGIEVSGALIGSEIEKPEGGVFGQSPPRHLVTGQSGNVGWQTIAIRTR